ncbi:rRNA adenine N-6-methyltransferase family protein [Actinocorallia longicatena]|uniref:Class I SAM-dependent methyltransferase n=1 Tax=Actinocorallia longicatena TaxID=111803 RepID=A0ABP6Q7R0_9ACTN
MNSAHLEHLSSPAWAAALRTEVLPWLRANDLGDDVLEIGPGPGLTTDLLLDLTPRLTAVEVDPDLAAALTRRLHPTTAHIIHGDALTTELPPLRYTSALCLSMLHHMESPQAQDRLLARLATLLRPGATLLGIEALDTEPIRRGHTDDTYVPLDPDTLPHRLHTAGFTTPVITRTNAHQYRFTATTPAP